MADNRMHGAAPWLADAAPGGSILGYTIALSALIHSALAVLPLPQGSPSAASPPTTATLLAATLVEVPAEAVEMATAPAAPVALPAGALASPPDSSSAAATPPATASRRAQPAERPTSDAPRRTVRHAIRVDPMHESARLGELQDREMTEFPREVDRPAVVDGAIRVQYPWRALAEGREDTVVIWAVVDPSGVVEEIQLVEGTPEFYERVAAAVKAHRFYPAIDAGTPLRFPIALEFRFRIDGANPPPSGTEDTATVR
ncbi:MAG: energy transducer TonB [Dongiaceae bacterium]